MPAGEQVVAPLMGQCSQRVMVGNDVYTENLPSFKECNGTILLSLSPPRTSPSSSISTGQGFPFLVAIAALKHHTLPLRPPALR